MDFEDPKLRVRSDTGSYDTSGGANFDQANFQLMDRNGRGFAKDIDVLPGRQGATLTQVRYTSCPVGNEDWMLQASSHQSRHQGAGGRRAQRDHALQGRADFLHALHLLSRWAMSARAACCSRASAIPAATASSCEVPYYFNLAPNYDLTLTPGVSDRARRAARRRSFAILTASSHGQLDATFPAERQAVSTTTAATCTSPTSPTSSTGLRFDADIASVSDSNYFQDFAVGSDQTSVTFLERRADLLYYDDIWRIRAQLQNFQTIDISDRSPDRDGPTRACRASGERAVADPRTVNFELRSTARRSISCAKSGPTGRAR